MYLLESNCGSNIEAEKIYPENSVDFSKCQIEKILDAYNNDPKSVEWECFSPYLMDYDASKGEIWPEKLTNTDKIGIKLARMFRKIFSEASMVSLYDEYNSDAADSSSQNGRPVEKINGKHAPQLFFTKKVQNTFRDSIKTLLHQKSIIDANKDEKEGNYLLIAESSKIKAAKKLVSLLEQKKYIQRKGEKIIFENPQAKNPDFQQITLRTANGKWLCEALDASAFLKSENFKKTHLIILPNHFKKQQDRVWEILRVLGIKPDNYHNIFYDENADPQTVTDIIKGKFEQKKECFSEVHLL